MNRCLSERALFDITAGEGSAAQHAHLRLCPDCAERYDEFTDDLQAISGVLIHPPLAARAASHKLRSLSDLEAHGDQPCPEAPRRGERSMEKTPAAGPLVRWVPIAAAATVLLALGLTMTRLHAPPLARTATHSENVPAFAADVSAALFASGDDGSAMQIASGAPYLQAALEGGLLCTQERFFDGECDDQVAALVLESD